MRTVMTTDQIPGTERLAYFWEALSQDTAPAKPYVEGDETVHGRMDADALAAVDVVQITTRSQARRGLCRDLNLIRRSDPDDYRLAFSLDGPMMLTHNDRQTELAPGDMMLLDMSRPYDAWHQPGAARFLVFAFSRRHMPLPRTYADQLVGARMSGRSGIGALLHTVATQVARDLGKYDQTDAVHLSTMVLDLVGGVLAHELGATRKLPAESQQQVMLQRVRGFIQQQLGDSELTPAVIAEAHHISLRSLHRLFECGGCTVAEWIRTQRLECCRRELADPLRGDQPIHAIARRWGFPSHAQFTRAFRTAYGLSPREYRHQQPTTSRLVR